MNNYALASESRRWWWPSAAAGALATAAVAAILVVPAAGNAIPVDDAPTGGTHTWDPGGIDTDVGFGTRPCFLVRSRWNVAADAPQPLCGEGLDPAAPPRKFVIRLGLGFGA